MKIECYDRLSDYKFVPYKIILKNGHIEKIYEVRGKDISGKLILRAYLPKYIELKIIKKI
jgi:hypothetical protein